MEVNAAAVRFSGCEFSGGHDCAGRSAVERPFFPKVRGFENRIIVIVFDSQLDPIGVSTIGPWIPLNTKVAANCLGCVEVNDVRRWRVGRRWQTQGES